VSLVGRTPFIEPLASLLVSVGLVFWCSVLVHDGNPYGGRFYAVIRPKLDSQQWFKFDDERVTKETTKMAVEEQFGGEEEVTAAPLFMEQALGFRM
jgi:hypothetical protein